MTLIRNFYISIISILLVTNVFPQSWALQERIRTSQTIMPYEILAINFPPMGGILVGGSYGCYYSSDDGKTWNLKNNGIGSVNVREDVCSIFSQPNGTILIGTSAGIRRSIDSARTWSLVSPPSMVYTYNIAENSKGYLFGTAWFGQKPGVYRSKNNGLSWIKVTPDSDTLNVEALWVTPGDTIYAGTYRYHGIIRSTDGGDTWTYLQKWTSVRSLFVDKRGTILAGMYDPWYMLQYSKNNGLKWDSLFSFYPEAFLESTSGRLFCATDYGVVRFGLNDYSFEWMNNGLRNKYGNVPHLRSFTKAPNGDLFAGEIYSGELFRSTDEGLSWKTFSQVSVDLKLPTKLSTIRVSDNTIYTASSISGIFRSDNGSHFVHADSGIPAYPINTIFINSSKELFAGTNGIYKSTNGGTYWKKFGSPTAVVRALTQTNDGSVYGGTTLGPVKFSSDGSLVKVMTDGLSIKNTNVLITNNLNRVFAGTDEGVFRLDSVTWIPLTASLGTIRVTSLVHDGTILVAGTLDSGIYFSPDEGKQWMQFNNGLKERSLTSIVIAGNDSLFVVTTGGNIYKTSLHNPLWQRSMIGITDTLITAMAIGKSNKIYACSDSGNIYQGNIVTTIRSELSPVPEQFILEQNYPNPFNPSTSIRYSLPSSATVKLGIYDLLGREIATLVNEEQSAGWKEVKWNAIQVSSGIYFYKLQAGNFVETKKLMFLK